AGRPAVAGPDGPAAKPAPAVAKPPEPAWRKDFDRAYALKDGEVLKRVPPPYPAARAEYLKAELLGGIPVGPGDRLDHWHALFRWADGRLYGEASVCGRPGKPAAVALQELLTRLVPDLLPNEIEGDEELLRAVGVDGDFVVRHGADPAKVAARLGEILRTELKLPVKVGVREAEREVAVAVGPLKVEPLAGRPKDRVEVYGAEPADPKRGRAVRTGTVAEFLRDLSRFTGMRVVAGAGLDPKARLSWRENVRLPAPDADGPTRERMWAEDHDPAAVLRNVGDQTGLRFPAEKRKVRVLFAEYVEQ
ncbi:MAG: TIGR03435 family protein, partial [Gemmataceae bacterium]|nr:TIGR03435 family protein [Gemmataceae bacterium]